MRKALASILILGVLMLPAICHANGPGTTAASFLEIGIGARPTAMGDAYTALSSDGTSLYWNPAGLTYLKTREISAAYNSWFGGIRQGYLSFALPLSHGCVALGTNYVDMGKIDGRDEMGNPTGDFTCSDTHVFFGYANRFKNISWGVTVGWLQDAIGEDKKNTFLGTLGFLYPVTNSATVGIAAQNIGSRLGEDPLPLTLRAGVSAKFENITLAHDVVKPKDDEMYYCFGAEWDLGSSFALRAGYKTNQDIGEGITAGVGFKMERTRVDYAYVPYGDLGSTHRISFGIKF